MKLEFVNNQKKDALTAIKKYIKNVTIGTCTFAFSISSAVIVSKELDHLQKRQNIIFAMQAAEEISSDLTSVRQLIQSEQNAMIETMFASAIAREEAVKNENDVVVVAASSNVVNNQEQTEKQEQVVKQNQTAKQEQTVNKNQTVEQSTSQEQNMVQQPTVQQTTTESVEQTETVQTEQETSVSVNTVSEYDMLCRIVEAEATGGDIQSKMIVANVVLNRVKNAQFPNTIEGVIFQHKGNRYQFSPISDGRYYSVNVTDSTREAVSRAMAGEDNSQGALYFVSPRYGNTSWFDRNLSFLFYYGGHNYYK